MKKIWKNDEKTLLASSIFYPQKNAKKILINGDFLCRRLTGIERYAYEITRRLDNLISYHETAIIIPTSAENIPAYKNLEIIRLEKKSKSNIRWQMITLQWFLLTHRQYIILEFGNCCIPFAPGIVFLHDIYCEFFPEDFVSRRDKFARLYSRIQYRLITKLAKKIITVSEFSKNQISSVYNIPSDSIEIIGNGWEHIQKIESDYSIFSEYSALKEKKYYFTLGSLSKRKNLQWIIEYAKKHHDDVFAISGAKLSNSKKIKELNIIPDNVIMLGYINDAKIKALFEKCKAFVFPSYYEGFGIPPMEALACGAPVIISNAASLPEIYAGTAHYIDPFNTEISLDALLNEPVEPAVQTLGKYTYNAAAEKLYQIIKEGCV